MPQHPNQWVVDTWVLDEATKLDSPHQFNALLVLTTILDRHHVAVDSRGFILRQYEQCVDRCRRHPGRFSPELLRKWIATMWSKGIVHQHDGNVPNRHWRVLVAPPLSFDDDDEAFVGVAHRTPDRLLISEDGDYTEAVKQFVRDHLGVEVLTVSEAKDRLAG